MAILQTRAVAYTADEECLLRRLGCAVALQWKALPDQAKMLLMAQAVMVADPQQPEQLEQRLEEFLERTALKA